MQCCYLIPYQLKKKDKHDVEFCLNLVVEDFKQANIFTVTSDIQVLASKVENPRITKKKASLSCQNVAHNRVKNYAIPDGVPCDFLIRLGVMDKAGKVIPKHYSKFRQINRYLEIVDDVFPYLPEGKDKPIKIIDFGCGKAYLTFAIYYYLKIKKQRNVEIIGLDLKKDVIEFCNKVAQDLGYDELKFLMGDIADYTNDEADMVVTLHACDTATDYALEKAVKWGASVILSVPCCQHELNYQMKNEELSAVLKYGLLKERIAALVTDGLRAEMLEQCGYDTQVLEFIDMEHTPKNILIRGVKRENKRETDFTKYDRCCQALQVSPMLGRLLKE